MKVMSVRYATGWAQTELNSGKAGGAHGAGRWGDAETRKIDGRNMCS